MDELKYFDCNCMFGSWKENRGSSFDTLEKLSEHMEKYKINRILAYHSMSMLYDPFKGNEILAETAKGIDGIMQCWVVIPGLLDGFMNTGELLLKLKRNNVAGIRLFPKLHGFCFKDWAMHDLLSALEKVRIPVFLDFSLEHWSESPDWQDIYDACKNYPNIPFILVRTGLGANRNLYPLLKMFDNLFFEISYYQVNRGIEDIMEKFGSGRMIFGTGAPVYNPGCVISMLHFARISNEDKALIAGENLKRLIKGIDFNNIE